MIQLLSDANSLVLGADDDLPDSFDDVTRRILIEYYPLGSMADLLSKRVSEYIGRDLGT